MLHRIDFQNPFQRYAARTGRARQPRPSTFAEIIGIEPRIGDLLREAASLRSSRRVTWRDYETYRRRAERLVGRHAPRPDLGSAEAHDLVMHRLVAALGV